MVSEPQGKKMMEKIVQRYSLVNRNSFLVKDKHISEQDITTKFVLPMLAALNWDTYKIRKNGPEVHEKAYREKSNVGKGLPDIILNSENGKIFVEVKKPPLKSQGTSNLERYGDSNLVVLTSFEKLILYCRYKKNKPFPRRELRFDQYVPKFRKLWHILSNTEEGKHARAGFKATRHAK